jgi:hypothetical protein
LCPEVRAQGGDVTHVLLGAVSVPTHHRRRALSYAYRVRRASLSAVSRLSRWSCIRRSSADVGRNHATEVATAEGDTCEYAEQDSYEEIIAKTGTSLLPERARCD